MFVCVRSWLWRFCAPAQKGLAEKVFAVSQNPCTLDAIVFEVCVLGGVFVFLPLFLKKGPAEEVSTPGFRDELNFSTVSQTPCTLDAIVFEVWTFPAADLLGLCKYGAAINFVFKNCSM